MSIEARPINDSVLGFKTTAPTNSVTLCELDLETGNAFSLYFFPDQLWNISESARSLLRVVDPEDRELAAHGIMSRLITVASIDSGLTSIIVSVAGGIATAHVEVSGTRYFAVHFPHSLVGGLGFSGGDAAVLTSGTVVSSENSFVTTSPDTLQRGMLVARNRGGEGVVRANAIDPNRMPAVGMVAEVDTADGTYVIQTGGLVAGVFAATTDTTMFVGLNGYPTGNILPLAYVQPIGTWAGAALLNLNIATQLTIKPPS